MAHRDAEDSPRSAAASNRQLESLGLAGRAPAFRHMLEWLLQVAPSELPVLVQGESGSGKERISRALHALSSRREKPFVALNCTALPESLLEAELFGAVRGAYTGLDRDRTGLLRLAHGGTLLLDEVGDMPPTMQPKLLRALEERRVRPLGAGEELPVDVRVVTASHHDLADRVAQGAFRADLYYRLAVLVLRVPPLRERLEDLPALVEQLGPRLGAETGLGVPRLDPDAWEPLVTHDWPGNIRELHAVLARALVRAGGGVIRREHLALAGPAQAEPTRGPLERQMILGALAAADGRIGAAAARIGWSRQKLHRRMQALGVWSRTNGRGGGGYSARGTTSSDSSTFQ